MGIEALPRIALPIECRDGNGLYILLIKGADLPLGQNRALPDVAFVVVRQMDEAFQESRLRDGDRVVLETPKGRFLKALHLVEGHYVLFPLDDSEGNDRILTAPGSSEYKIKGKIVAFLGYLP